MNQYIYPDHNDALTVELIAHESNDHYWNASEEQVLSYAKARLKTVKAENMLDLGCGTGRLLPIFAPYTKNLLGVEPDEERCRKAMTQAMRIPNARVCQGTVDDVCGPFDAVVMSHVIQHIPTDLTRHIFQRLREVMAPGGLLILTTTFTDQEKDHFTRELSVDGKRRTLAVTQEEFDCCQENGVLPVRYFAPKTIGAFCNDYGFHIEKKACYHFTDSGVHSPENDAARNEQGDVQGARDILYLIIKD